MDKSTILIGCGGRDYQDYDQVLADLSRLVETHRVNLVVTGAARGADTLVARAARALELPVKEIKANWDQYGKGAGFRRNQAMLDHSLALVELLEGDEVLVLGWKVKPDLSLRRGGTEHMLDIARRANCRAHLFDGQRWYRLGALPLEAPSEAF